MSNFKQKFIQCLTFVFLITVKLSAQDILDWNYVVTGGNMTIMVPSDAVSFNDQEPPVGSLLGAFFVNDDGNLQCAGYSEWTGDLTTIAVWSDDNFTPAPDGFLNGDSIVWALFHEGESIIAEYVLMNTSPPYNDTYATNSFGQLLQANFILELSASQTNDQDGYEINEPCTSLNEYNSILLELNPIQSRDFNEGWNMFGFPCKESRSVAETFAEIVDDIYIIKNNEGLFYWPEFDFDGIENLIPLEGYQTKLYNPISDFILCNYSIDFPGVLGCTNCEALNFNPFANIDDGSCEYLGCTDNSAENYDSNANMDDGLCVYSGCMDPTADNFNPNATLPVIPPSFCEYWGCLDASACNFDMTANLSNESCEYAQDGFDCNGNCMLEILIDNFYGPGLSEGEGEEIEIYLNRNTNQITYSWVVRSEFFDGQINHILTLDDLQLEVYINDQFIENVSEHMNLGQGTWLIGDEYQQMQYIGFYDQIDLSNYCGNSIQFELRCQTICGTTTLINKNLNIDPPFGYDCQSNPINYNIGDYAQGGIVFYMDESGEHGLVAAMEDIGEFEWGCYENFVIGADGLDIGSGYLNTQDIVNQSCNTNSTGITAAQAALEYEFGGYNDWYLPSRDELHEMYFAIHIGEEYLSGQSWDFSNLGDFEEGGYWSSTEYWNGSQLDASYAWIIYFWDEGDPEFEDKIVPLKVRPIRSF